MLPSVNKDTKCNLVCHINHQIPFTGKLCTANDCKRKCLGHVRCKPENKFFSCQVWTRYKESPYFGRRKWNSFQVFLTTQQCTCNTLFSHVNNSKYLMLIGLFGTLDSKTLSDGMTWSHLWKLTGLWPSLMD